MTDEEKVRPQTEPAGSGRKPYTAPRLDSEEIFETSALACGKLAGQGGSCNGSPMHS